MAGYCINIWNSEHEPTKWGHEHEAFAEVVLELSGEGYGRSYVETIIRGKDGATVIDFREEAAQEILEQRNWRRELRGMGPVPAPRDPMVGE